MKLFLAVVERPTSAAAAAVAAQSDDVALFDDGVWGASGPSERAVPHVTAAYVARRVCRGAALTQLVETAQGDALCFRYGPRPSAHLDALLFHQHSAHAAAQAAVAAPSDATPSPVVSPPSPASSFDTAPAGPLPPPHRRVTGAETSAAAREYDSVLALWLRELLAGSAPYVGATALFLSVDGTAIDLVAGTVLHTALSVDVGTPQRLRTYDDARAFLRDCELAVRESAWVVAPHSPYHVCITVHVGRTEVRAESSRITFLDVASALHGEGSPEMRTRLRAQTKLFHRLLEAEEGSAIGTLPVDMAAPHFADRRWFGLLQSCQLARTSLVGLVHIPQTAPQDPFKSFSAKEECCAPFSLATALRQRALADAVNNGTLRRRPSVKPVHVHEQRRPRGSDADKRRVVASAPPQTSAAPSLTSVPSPVLSLPPLRSPPTRDIQRVPPQQRRETTAPRRAIQVCVPRSAPANRRPDPFRSAPTRPLSASRLQQRLEAAEEHARRVLVHAEQRARELAEMRLVLQARPPGASVDAVVRHASHDPEQATRPEQSHRRAAPTTHRSPPPALCDTQLQSALVRPTLLPSLPASPHSSSPRVPSPQSVSSPVFPWVRMPALTDTPSSPLTQYPDPFAQWRAASPVSPRLTSLMTPLHDSPRARSVTYAEAGQRRSLASTARRRQSLGGPDVYGDCSPSGPNNIGRRRYSTLEVALLARAQSASQHLPPAEASQTEEVERLYPLVHAFHAEVNAQDAVMAEELMMRTRIELKELNRRKVISGMFLVSMPDTLDGSPRLEANVDTPQRSPGYERRRSLQPRPSRVFFN